MILMLDAQPEEEAAIEILERQFVKGNNAAAEQVQMAVKDAYKRMLKFSMETEVRMSSKKRADEEAIRAGRARRHKDALLRHPRRSAEREPTLAQRSYGLVRRLQ